MTVTNIHVQTSRKLHYKYRDEIKLYVNNLHSGEHLHAKKLPLVLWSCQLLPCPVCDGEGYEVVHCQRFDHRGQKNSKYVYKDRCGVCLGHGVAWIDKEHGIDYSRHSAHLMAWQGHPLQTWL